MFQIKTHEVELKSQELNFKQRMYQNKSIVTVQMMADFYPIKIGDSIIRGGIDIKLDLEDLKSIHELEEKEYQGAIGYVTISVNNHGVWEHLNLEEFKIKFGKREGNKLWVSFECEEVTFHLLFTMVSLYTTSTDEQVLGKHFDLSDFYEEPIESMVGKRKICKYFMKQAI